MTKRKQKWFFLNSGLELKQNEKNTQQPSIELHIELGLAILPVGCFVF